MNSSLEPRVTKEQCELLYELGLREYHPTISMARNWLFEKFGVLLQTRKYGDDPHYFDCLCDDKMHVHACSSNLHTAESECLTKMLINLNFYQK